MTSSQTSNSRVGSDIDCTVKRRIGSFEIRGEPFQVIDAGDVPVAFELCAVNPSARRATCRFHVVMLVACCNGSTEPRMRADTPYDSRAANCASRCGHTIRNYSQ